MITSFINVNGGKVEPVLTHVDPDKVFLDPNNHRIAFMLEVIPPEERTEIAIAHLLFTQEDVQRLKKSIKETNGIQEAIFVKSNGVVVEGNRRTASVRELKKEYPENLAFQKIPAWVFPEDTPESIIEEIIYNFHLSHKRTWPPFERAQIFKKMFTNGTTIASLAARWEMKEDEVKQFIEAIDLIHAEYIPLLDDPADPETRNKFSYFIEYVRSPRNFVTKYPTLDKRFSEWVHNGTFSKAEKVRRLGKILANPNALLALDEDGFDAAIEVLIDQDPNEDPQFKAIDKATRCLRSMSPSDILELRNNLEKQTIIQELAQSVNVVLQVSRI